MKPLRKLAHLVAEDSGAAMVEYGIALVVVATLGTGAVSFLADAASANMTSSCIALGTSC